MRLENLELNGRDAGLHEGDMRLTPDQVLMIESGAGDVRGSITTGKWPGAVLAYEIESSLSKLFDLGDEFPLITSGLRLILFFSFTQQYQSSHNELFSYFFLQNSLVRSKG